MRTAHGLLAPPNKRMHQTWRGHGVASHQELPRLDGEFLVPRRATQVMRGR